MDVLLLFELLEKATKHLLASSYPFMGDIHYIFEVIQINLKKYMMKEDFTQH